MVTPLRFTVGEMSEHLNTDSRFDLNIIKTKVLNIIEETSIVNGKKRQMD